MKQLVIIFIAFTYSWMLNAQSPEKIAFNRGVNAYEKGEYAKATESFKKAYDLNGDYLKALFNAGNAAYLSGAFEDSKQLFADYTRFADSRMDKAKAHYNIGNIALQNGKAIEKELIQVAKDQEVSYDDKMKLFDTSQEEYKSAIKSYKESLRNNSSDQDVKFNLTYALKHLKHIEEQQQEQEQKGDPDKDKKEKDEQEGEDSKDKKDGEQGEDGEPKDGDKDGEGDKESDKDSDKEGEGDKKDEEGKDGKEEENDKDPKDDGKEGDKKGAEEEKEIEGQISKAQAAKELDAMNNDEQKLLMKVFRSKEDKKKPTNSKKDW